MKYLVAFLAVSAACAQSPKAPLSDAARDAFERRDSARLASLAEQARTQQHPLASWADYWRLNRQLASATRDEVEAFYQRWPGSYVEDRLRNDWLLELGKRRDWVNFRAELPRFRMSDDQEVACYALLLQHQDGQDVRAAARSAWYAQREADDGCTLLAETLVQARVFSAQDVWQEVRLAVENNRPRAARVAAAMVNPAAERALA
ncbi:MAG: lytic transglycosylase domain-containing protein, partial [Inhella sp.]